MSPGHLVTRLQAPLDRQINLDHLDHARRQFVPLGELLALFLERQVELMTLLRQAVLELLELLGCLFIGKPDVEPMVAVQIGQIVR